MFTWLHKKFTAWLTKLHPVDGLPMCDFERLRYEVKPADVLLIEGRSRVSDAIRTMTQSPWTHAVLYIGKLHDIEDANMRARVLEHYPQAQEQPLVIESLLGMGTIVSPLSKYHSDHIRICRPKGILAKDAQRVVNYTASRLGSEYDVRHVLDLARLLYPWNILPRRWRSSLFMSMPKSTTREICSLMISEAFAKVMFPILPQIDVIKSGNLKLRHRNPRLYTPSDFDYSPYFEIIKYPIFELGAGSHYRNLPWDEAALAKAGKRAPLPSAEEVTHTGPAQSTQIPMAETIEVTAPQTPEVTEGAIIEVDEASEEHHPSWQAQISRKSPPKKK